MATLVVHLVAGGRSRTGLAAAATFVLGFASLWTLCGQSPSGFPAFVRGEVEISSGFSEAMSVEGKPVEVVAGAAVLALLAAGCIASRRGRLGGRADALNGLAL